MGLEVTPEAIEVLRRSLQLGGLDQRPAGIRLRAARGLGGGLDVQVELADGPMDEESVLESDGIRLFVDPEVSRVYPDAVVTVEPQHDVVVVRPRQP
jgi:Fe-S cluster assembly iron-binding protein IscA